MFVVSNYSPKSKYYNDSNKLVVGKMTEETGSAVIEKFVWLKPKMYLFFVVNSSEYKKTKAVNKNVVATIKNN